MAKFGSKKPKATPKVSTASLPDIVFMLLFFFMVATVLREKEILVLQRLPKATELDKLEKRTEISYIYVGAPQDKSKGTTPRIQLNDAFATVEDIGPFIVQEKSKMANPNRIEVLLKGDKEINVGIVNDIEIELRKINARNLTYGSIPKSEPYK